MDERDARALLPRFGQSGDQFADCFTRRAQCDAATQYLDGLFNDRERKSMQALHGRLSDPITYDALQHFITHAPWSADRVWERLRDLVPVRTGLLAIDETSLPKQGKRSVAVKRQYCGAKGKIANCQVAVSSVLLADGLTWPLTFELYVPKEWVEDADRRADVGLPEGVRFREKWRIALAHVRRVLEAGFTLTAVLADADYGRVAGFRRGVEKLGLAYAVAIPTRAARRREALGAVATVSPTSAAEHEQHEENDQQGSHIFLFSDEKPEDRRAGMPVRPLASRY